MLKLIKNEYAKIFYKKTTYIILVLCLITGLGISSLIYSTSNSSDQYKGIPLSEELQWYAKSEYVSDILYYNRCELFISLGYVYTDDVPQWFFDMANDYYFSHYKYIYLSEYASTHTPEETEMLATMEGIYLSDTDIEYEKDMTSKLYTALKAQDFKTYYSLTIQYCNHQIENNLIYDSAIYEFAKYITEKNINPKEDDDLYNLLIDFAAEKVSYDAMQSYGNGLSELEKVSIESRYFIRKYIIDNNIEKYMYMEDNYENSNSPFMTALIQNTIMAALCGIFIIVIAAGIFANEYSSGTVKFLLINPVKRCKIFWSKYITCISLYGATLIVFFILYFIFTLALYGSDGIDGSFLTYADGTVSSQSVIMYSIKQYGLTTISMISSITMAFMISSFLRNTAIAIAVSLVIEFAGSMITSFLYFYGHDWGRYLIFSNTDFTSFSNGLGMFPGQTVTFAAVTICIYMAVFLLTAYDGFTRKEI